MRRAWREPFKGLLTEFVNIPTQAEYNLGYAWEREGGGRDLFKRFGPSGPTDRERTRETWGENSRQFKEQMGKAEVRAFREALLAPDAKTGKGKGSLAPATVRKNLTRLGTVLSYAVRTGLIETNPASGMAFVARDKTQNLEKRRLPFSDDVDLVCEVSTSTRCGGM